MEPSAPTAPFAARRFPWGAVALGAGLAALLMRLHRLELASFILDEPSFLLASKKALEEGSWPSHSSIGNSSGFPYGPTPEWFYRVVQALFGSKAEVNIGAMCLTVILCQLAFSLMLTRRLFQAECPRGSDFFRDDRARLGLGLTLLVFASPPAQWFWSRLAWDLFTLFTPFLALALTLVPRPGPLRCAVLGLLLGLAFSAHPMIAPLTALIGLSVAWALRATPWRAVRELALMGAAFVLVNLPWALFLSRTPSARLGPRGAGVDFSPWRLFEVLIPGTTYRAEYWFERDWASFAQFAPGLLSLPWVQWTGAALLGAAALWGWIHLARSPQPELRRLSFIALACLLAYPLFFGLRRTLDHPHYQFPVSFWVVGGVAVTLVQWVRGAGPRWQRPAVWGLSVGAALGVGLNFTMQHAWKSYLASAHGTRGIRIGTVLGAQREALAKACALAPTVFLANETLLFEPSLRQLASTLPPCQGRALHICPGHCPPPPAGAALVRLHYAGPSGAGLQVSSAR